MKKLFVALFVLILLGCLIAPAFAQTYTRLGASQVIYTADNQPDTKAFLTIFKVIYAGRPVTLAPKTYRTDSSGYLLGDDGQRGIRLIQGAQIWAYANFTIVPGINRNPNAGTQYTVPASSATQLEELIYDLTLFGSKGSSLWGTASGKPSTLSVGADGYVLQADSAQTLGVKWAALSPSAFGAQLANRVMAGPTTGSAAVPTFRALVAADIPDLSATYLPLAGGTLTGNLTLAGAPSQNLHAATKAYVDSAVAGAGQVASVFGRTGTVVAAINDYTWAQIDKTTSSLADITTRSASDLSSGTLPDARFPATLPAISGANLTALNASNLASGTVPLARLSGITNNEISNSAAIAYSKLNLAGAILNADLAGSIANNKLSNSAITIAGTSTSLGGSITASAILDSIGSTRGSILYRGASGWTLLTPGTSGYALVSNGAGADPSFQSVSSSMSIGGTVTSATAGRILFSASGPVLADSANLFWDNSQNFLGIGTSSPTGSLHAQKDNESSNFIFSTASNTGSDVSQIRFRKSRGTHGFRSQPQVGDPIGTVIFSPYSTALSNYINGAEIKAITDDADANNPFIGITFATSYQGTTTEAMRIDSRGRLGINSTSPTAKLDVRISNGSTVGQIIRLASGQAANALNVENSTGTLLSAVLANGAFYSAGVAFASLGTPSNGTFVYCTDCTIASPCASGGTGALAKRLNGAWVCN